MHPLASVKKLHVTDYIEVLARDTQPIEPSPQAEHTKLARIGDDWVDEPDAPAPRLSVPLNELEDDDSFHIDPPTMSAQVEADDNVTAHSFEGPRRALAEMGNSRLSRGSLGSIRASDQFGDLKHVMDVTDSEEDVMEGDENTGTVTKFGLEDGNLTLNVGYVLSLPFVEVLILRMTSENTQEMRAILNAASRRQSRLSDAGPFEPEDEEPDPTFLFALPEFQNEQPADQGLPVAGSPFPAGSPPVTEGVPVAKSPSIVDGVGDDEPVVDSDIGEDEEPQDYSDEESPAVMNGSSALGNSLAIASTAGQTAKPAKKLRKREVNVSRKGIEYPSLPSTVIKRVASNFARSSGGGSAKIGRETLSALSQATEWFFEQVSDDLASYSEHAGRKTIDETDVITLMRRYVHGFLWSTDPMVVDY